MHLVSLMVVHDQLLKQGLHDLQDISPFFIIEGANGSTLCCSTALACHGEALDIKTPLLRANNVLSTEVTKFLHLIGKRCWPVCLFVLGTEQEYFLVDRAFYYSRPDLVMTGKTLIGKGIKKPTA